MTEQMNNDSGSRRLRREEERRRQLEALLPSRPIEVPPVGPSGVQPTPVEPSPVERGWQDDVAPPARRSRERSVEPTPSTPSRRELRERAAASAGTANSGSQPSVDETWGAPRTTEPEAYRPDPTSPARQLSRRELRELREGAAGAPAGPQQDGPSGFESRQPEAPRPEAPRYDAPRNEAPRYDAPRNEAPRYDAPQVAAPRYDAPQVAPPPIARWEDPNLPVIQRERGQWTPREPVPNPADLETSGPSRPAQPTSASNGESYALGREEAPVRASEPEPEQARPAGDPVEDEPARISPLARAAAIRAQAARQQQEQEDAARARYEQLQSRRAEGAQPDAQAPQGQPPASMWGQRQEPNRAAQPATAPEAANGYPDRPPVRRVVLPPTMSAGTGPADVPALGLGSGQPQVQPQVQPQAQPQHPAGVPPQQYQGLPQGGPMPANGQPFATVSMGPADRGMTQTATAPARPATGGPGGPPNLDGSGPLPRWGSVGTAGWTPTPSSGPNGQPLVSGPNGQPPVGPVSQLPAARNGARHDQAQDAHADETTHRHPYTWLHMIVLVLVAFVLGMLIFMLVIKDATADGATADVGQLTAVALAATTEQVGD